MLVRHQPVSLWTQHKNTKETLSISLFFDLHVHMKGVNSFWTTLNKDFKSWKKSEFCNFIRNPRNILRLMGTLSNVIKDFGRSEKIWPLSIQRLFPLFAGQSCANILWEIFFHWGFNEVPWSLIARIFRRCAILCGWLIDSAWKFQT